MGSLGWKTRISVLWLFMAVAMSAHCLVFFFEPGAIEKIISGEMALGPGTLFQLMSLFWLVPLVMAFLSVTLTDVANRWTNIILGTVFIVLNFSNFVQNLAEPSVHRILIIGSTVVVAALIFWYAWRWPKQKV